MYPDLIFVLLLTLSAPVMVHLEDARFCNETSTSIFQLQCRACPLNSHILCPKGMKQLTTGRGDFDCSYQQAIGTHLLRLKGCRHKCERTTLYASCCEYYWGSQCEECPGGADNPCNGNGYCEDGVEGPGTCLCLDAFNGTECELCADPRMYGQNCTQVCQCVNGTCNNGLEGDGSCDCDSGFTGDLCDQEILGCENMTCADDARCILVDGNATCVCDQGYEDDDLEGCKEIDSCISSPCHQNAWCKSMGPALYRCTCHYAYRGDGQYCQPIDNCQDNNGDCVQNTSVCVYVGPAQHHCDCISGYENYRDQLGCSLIDLCARNSSLCHRHATCRMLRPYQVECVCEKGYVGDGQLCYGNLLQRIYDLNTDYHDTFGNSLHLATRVFEVLFGDLLTNHGPFTLFVPVDRGFKSVFRTGLKNFLADRDRSRQIIRQHIIVAQLNLADLMNNTVFYTLQGNSAELQARGNSFRFKLHGTRDKGRIMKRDIVASNGVIHIINSLMTSQPDQLGDNSRTIFDLINSEGRHNRFVTLINIAGMQSWFTQKNLTVFAPSNGAWDNLPEGTLDYLQSHKGRSRLITLLQGHIFMGKIRVADLINTQRIRSLGKSAVTVTVTKLGQIQLNGNVNISQTDIPGKRGIYHHIEGILLPEGMTSVLPHRCDTSTSKLVWGTCVTCQAELKCPSTSDVPLNETMSGCTYWVKKGARYIQFKGCARRCNRTYVNPHCCENFYGRKCKPCPGAFKDICSGHGKCTDGYNFNGQCICEPGFMGDSCDKCSDHQKYGQNCSEVCTCNYGNCDNGPMGSGKCKTGSCKEGYKGENCDSKQTVCGKHTVTCHAHAVCIADSTESRCVCKPGYEGMGLRCTEIDPCTRPERGHCHTQAVCTKTGPGMNQCECDKGWMGDGTSYCYRTTPCVVSATCHQDATCTPVSAGKYVCMCNKGYHGNGTYCSADNRCAINNGGCHPLAMCKSVKPDKTNCTCPEDYGGDGRECYSTIAMEINDESSLTELTALLKVVNMPDNMLADKNGSYTLFAPNNDAIRRFKTSAAADFWKQEGNVLTMLGYHMLSGSYSITELKQLTELLYKVNTLASGMSANVSLINQNELYVNDARVVKADIPAINGYIHIVDKVLEPYPVSVDRPSLTELFESKPDFSIFYSYMQKSGLLSRVDAMDRYTVFVPTNYYLEKSDLLTKGKDFLSMFVLPKILLTSAIEDDQTESMLLGSRSQLHFVKKRGKIWVNDVLIGQPDMLTDGGVVHGLAGVILSSRRRCDVKVKNALFGTCVACDSNPVKSVCKEGFTRYDQTLVQTKCMYGVQGEDGTTHQYLGCQAWCHKVQVIAGCCSGFYGPDCLECPGGSSRPCSDRGVCMDSGYCWCNDRYNGRICERCDDDQTGPDCNISTNTCDYNNGGCSLMAKCSKVDGVIMCVCNPGYIGADGRDCKRPCAFRNGGCHLNARCSYQNNTVVCECQHGYHGDGKHHCEPSVDPCHDVSGPCSLEAPCTYSVISGSVVCSCRSDYHGNQTGTFCSNKNIFEALENFTSASVFYQLLSNLPWSSDIQTLVRRLQDDKDNITVFVPVNTGINKLRMSWGDVRNHVVVGRIYMEARWLYDHGNTYRTMGGNTLVIRGSTGFTVNGVRILQPNLPALNGLVHLIASPLWYGTPSTDMPSSTPEVRTPVTQRSIQSQPSIVGPVVGAVAGVIVLVAVVLAVVWFRKVKATSFIDLRKRFRKGSDNSLSLARIHTDQDEDIDQPESPPVKNFDNPLYNVKDGYDSLEDD